MNEQYNTNTHCVTKHVCWTAVFVGALVAIGLSVLLNLFSVAIGLSAFTTTKEGMTVLAVGGFIGVLIGVIAAMFTAGFTAGYIGRKRDMQHHAGILHGFIAWCLALIFTVILAAQIGQYITGYAKFIAHPAVAVMNATSHSESVDITVEKEKQTASTSAETESATNKIGFGAFVVFILFFVGALSSCFGGYFGMACRAKCDEKCDRR